MLDDTEVRDVRAQALERGYQVNGALKLRRYPGLETWLAADEDHASVFPLVLTHGLRVYLKTVR